MLKGKDGKYDAAEIKRARLAGLAMDKSKKLVEAEAAEPGTLSQAKLIAQIDKLKIETKMLQLELDEAEGKLVAVDEAVSIVTRREAEKATRLRVWEESETAKNPPMREIIREAAGLPMYHFVSPLFGWTTGGPGRWNGCPATMGKNLWTVRQDRWAAGGSGSWSS